MSEGLCSHCGRSMEEAARLEKEECAKVADHHFDDGHQATLLCAGNIAAYIRARGEKDTQEVIHKATQE